MFDSSKFARRSPPLMGNEVSSPQPLLLASEEDSPEMRARIELLDLPSELILKICTYLPPLDLLQVQLVSSFFHAFVRSSTLRYVLACERSGDVPTQDQDFFPVAERLDLLEKRECNWEARDGKWEQMQVERESTIYELQGSIFIRGTNYLPPKDASPNELDHLRPCSIQLHALPSLSTIDPSPPPPPPPVNSNPITLDFNVGPFLDLTLDPGQNLIVLATRASNGTKGRKPLYQIHLMDMEGKPREGTKKQVLDVDVTLEEGVYGTQATQTEGVESGRMLLQVLESTLVCLVSNTVTELEQEIVICWNWRTGEVISRLPVPETLVYPSISLLTPRSYVFLGFTVNGICPILSTYHIDSPATLLDRPRPPPPRSSSLHLPRAPPPSLLATEISSRLFPALHRDALSQPIMLLDIRPDPPSSNTPFVFGGVEKRRRPHTTNPSRGVLEFDLLAGNRLFYVHMLRDELVEEVEDYELRARKGGEDGKEVEIEERPMKWEQWGEKGCRMFEASNPVQRSWVTFVEGYRTISHRSCGPAPTHHDVVLRDFAPYRLHHPIPTQPSSEPLVPPPSHARTNLVKTGGSSSSWETSSSSDDFPPLPEEPIDDGSMRLVSTPTKVLAQTRAGHSFKEDVVTSLPYREGVVKLPEGMTSEGVMLDGDHLVVTSKAMPGGQTWMFHVLSM